MNKKRVKDFRFERTFYVQTRGWERDFGWYFKDYKKAKKIAMKFKKCKKE